MAGLLGLEAEPSLEGPALALTSLETSDAATGWTRYFFKLDQAERPDDDESEGHLPLDCRLLTAQARPRADLQVAAAASLGTLKMVDTEAPWSVIGVSTDSNALPSRRAEAPL